MNRMTVKELKELLNNYNENDIVEISGGESAYGEYAELNVGKVEIVKHQRVDGSEFEVEDFIVDATIMEY